ncbi:MAG: hypothetical protein C4346_11885 [Chloroflexota bacterium]
MFHDRENLIGLLLLGLCAVVAGILIWQIGTGNRLRYNGPDWLIWLLAIIMIGGSLYGLARGGDRRWPNPHAGQRPWWRKLFARKHNGQEP